MVANRPLRNDLRRWSDAIGITSRIPSEGVVRSNRNQWSNAVGMRICGRPARFQPSMIWSWRVLAATQLTKATSSRTRMTPVVTPRGISAAPTPGRSRIAGAPSPGRNPLAHAPQRPKQHPTAVLGGDGCDVRGASLLSVTIRNARLTIGHRSRSSAHSPLFVFASDRAFFRQPYAEASA